MLYYMHELQRLSMLPARAFAEATRMSLRSPLNPLAYTQFGNVAASAAELFVHSTRRYGKPEWGLESTVIEGRKVPVEIEESIHRTYCSLIHFKRETERKDPRMLVVAPLSGHYATLLRGTVEALLPDHDVYVTDWQDARMIPVEADRFNLSDYIDYVIDFLHYLGPNTHVMAVCQPSVPVMAAASVMSGWGDTCVPASMTLIGGPIDTRKSPTRVNQLAKEQPLEWFERNVVVEVPPPYPGVGRKVYPGFIQLTNFVAMNLDRHIAAYNELFEHLVAGDEDAAEKKLSFYEEYRAVMDLPAEFYLETVKTVFQDHALPRGEMVARWQPVCPQTITRTAILCIEGELDDISGVGQTKAALEMTPNLPDEMKHYHLQPGAGHYGVFNGSKWRNEILPVLRAFVRQHDHELGANGCKGGASVAAWQGEERRAAKSKPRKRRSTKKAQAAG